MATTPKQDTVSSEVFHHMVQEAAYYRHLERTRSVPFYSARQQLYDWQRAQSRLVKELGRWPTDEEIGPWAEHAARERVARQQLEDWFAAEAEIKIRFVVG